MKYYRESYEVYKQLALSNEHKNRHIGKKLYLNPDSKLSGLQVCKIFHFVINFWFQIFCDIVWIGVMDKIWTLRKTGSIWAGFWRFGHVSTFFARKFMQSVIYTYLCLNGFFWKPLFLVLDHLSLFILYLYIFLEK